MSKSDAKEAQRLHLNGTLLSGKDDGLPTKLVVVVLANVFDTPEIVQERYDFKGSNVGRRTLPIDRTARDKSVGQEHKLQPPPLSEFGRQSIELDQGPVDLFGRCIRKSDTPEAWRESRASTIHYDSPMMPSHGVGGAAASHRQAEDMPSVTAVVDDISHLTLKEMDFQNRIFTGETQLIHLGLSRRSEVLSQLEDDTALLRKHGFMDYSMLVGIRIIPKIPPQQEIFPSSPGVSRRGSTSSGGSDADNSDFDNSSDDDNDHDEEVLSVDGTGVVAQRESDFSEKLDRFFKVFLKDLGEKAQGALREMSTLGEGMKVLSGIHRRGSSNGSIGGSIGGVRHGRSSSDKIEALAEDDDDNKSQLPAVELKPVCSSSRPSRGKGKGKGKGKDRSSVDMKDFDPDSFQTVRYAPRSADASGHTSRRPALADVVETTAAMGSGYQRQQQQQSHQANISAANKSHDSLPYPHPFMQQQGNPQQQEQPIWSKGVPSEGLPDGYEVVYYFGLIDILQKYNLVKWLEKNIKGANARYLGGGGGATGVTQNSVPLVHPVIASGYCFRTIIALYFAIN
ncbi:hypothetical protein BGZ65_002149 [Modicella reniformis]|uniref:PIPK domain-containing protein n=1 Tax=Modicella reniformis TaxID=1440133 RepID=A0A9P6J6A9_9FUNG|nr:hypothetical protein BGZ65_002149 [Modicella reniformis]